MFPTVGSCQTPSQRTKYFFALKCHYQLITENNYYSFTYFRCIYHIEDSCTVNIYLLSSSSFVYEVHDIIDFILRLEHSWLIGHIVNTCWVGKWTNEWIGSIVYILLATLNKKNLNQDQIKIANNKKVLDFERMFKNLKQFQLFVLSLS